MGSSLIKNPGKSLLQVSSPYSTIFLPRITKIINPRVPNPRHFHADSDPDPAFNFYADPDPDPAFNFNTDPDQAFHSDVDPDLASKNNADSDPTSRCFNKYRYRVRYYVFLIAVGRGLLLLVC